jgi:hypothetical protein
MGESCAVCGRSLSTAGEAGRGIVVISQPPSCPAQMVVKSVLASERACGGAQELLRAFRDQQRAPGEFAATAIEGPRKTTARVAAC